MDIKGESYRHRILQIPKKLNQRETDTLNKLTMKGRQKILILFIFPGSKIRYSEKTSGVKRKRVQRLKGKKKKRELLETNEWM